MTDQYASCDGRPLILAWKIDRQLFYTLEVDLAEAERIVPDSLEVIQLRPGVALMSLSIVKFIPGQFGPDSPGFNELVAAIHVAPDLGIQMPVPTMSIFTFSMLSDSAPFIAQEPDTLAAPGRLVSLKYELTSDMLGVTVSDEEGTILHMPSSHPEPHWVAKEMWGQHFTNTRGLLHGIWQWDGHLFEHQRNIPGWKLFPHSFWSGFDIRKAHGPYRTMLLQPNTLCNERFYAMRPASPLTNR